MKKANVLRKTTAFLAIGMMSLFGLTACGGGGSETTGAADGQVTIEVWDYLGQGASNDAMVASVASFEKANPNIKVKRTSFAFGDLSKSIVQGGVGGSVPDVAIIDNVDNQNFAALGLLKDITADAGSMSKEFFPGPWSSTQFDGKTYGLPLNSNNLALFYNKDMMKEAGVEPPTNWDELKATAEKLTTKDHVGLALSGVKNEQGTFQVLPFVWQTGGDLDDYATSGGKALTYLHSLIESGAMSSSVSNYSQEDVRTQFVTEKSAMMVNGPWEIPNLKDATFEWGVIALPKDERAATGLGGENIVSFANAKQGDAAVTFMKFITSKDGAKEFCDIAGQLSSREDLSGKLKLSSDESLQVFEKQLADAHARAYGGKYVEISKAIQDSIQEAFTGAKTPDAAAKDAAAIITPLLP